jgi:hypothetical protein
MIKKIVIILLQVLFLLTSSCKNNSNKNSNNPMDIEYAMELTQYGITWYFKDKCQTGQFANGDYWVVGPVTIVGISPDVIVNTLPGGGVGYNNGWEVNPMCTGNQGFDVGAWASSIDPYLGFDPDLVPVLPYTAQPGSSIVKAVSQYPGNITDSYLLGPALRTAAVLTVLESAPPDNGATVFRPPYVGTEKPLIPTGRIRTDLLPSKVPVAEAPTLSWVESYFQRMRIEHTGGRTGRIIRPADNYLQYDDICYMPQEAWKIMDGLLRLMLNDPVEDKMTALIYALQAGIDEYYAMKNGNHWGAILGQGGGYECGHKILMSFAAYLLDDDQMKSDITAGDFYAEDVIIWRSSASNMVLWGALPPLGSWKTARDPNGYIDSPHGGYQEILSGPFKGSVILLTMMPDIQSFWGSMIFADLAEYVDRYVTVGRWYQPDPFAAQRTIPSPYTGYESLVYVEIFIPRYNHGDDADYHHYTSVFQKNMYDAYRSN